MGIDYSKVLNGLEREMLEAKRIWYENGKQEEWDQMWGHIGKHRYDEARKGLTNLMEGEK